MITTTRCPSCKTRFRVSDEQLRHADGWVRCGHCADIFDATLSLRRGAESEAQAQPDPEPAGAPAPADRSWGDAAADPQRVRRRQPLESDTAATAPEPVDTVAVATPEPEFVREARRREFWQRPAARWSLRLAALLLLAGLGLQWALHERERLAAAQPAWQPQLAQLCDWLGCSVGPWRQIDALRIDSASLLHKQGNDYRLDVVLQNAARQPVALPALELSLTDSREQVIVRRVLLPAEVSAETVVPGGGELSLSLPLQVRLEGGQTMAGYRTLIFYP